MPEYNIVIENRSYKVELAKKESFGIFEAKINDKSIEVKLVRKNETKAISPFLLEVADRTYTVEFERIDRHAPFILKINTLPFKLQFKEPKKKITEQAPKTQFVSRKRQTGKNTIQKGAVVAPMAGKIISVKIRKGDPVKIGDVVCILEAMKMENEVTAIKTGKIEEVNITDGTPVNEGDILVVIK